MKTVVNHVLILELNSKDTVGVEMLQSQVRAGAGELPEKLGGVSFPLPKTLTLLPLPYSRQTYAV